MPIADSNLTDANANNDVVEFINFDQWFEEGSYAYFIGISKFNDEKIHTLNSPENDINSLKEVLEDKNKHGFTVKEVVLQNQQPTASLPNPLLNPTKQQVLDFVTNIKCGEDSRVIVYFAGHGIAENTEVDEKPAGFLIPSDAQLGNQSTYVKMSDIHDALSKLKCRHLLIILDCCYAGAFRWADTKRSLYTGKPTTIYYQKFLQFTTNSVRQVITSTSADQQALDAFGTRGESGLPNSPFAQTLIKALSYGNADYGTVSDRSDGLITVTELGMYLKENLNNLQLKQIPAVWNIGDNTKGEFIFLNPQQPKRILVRFGKNRSNPYKGLAAYSTKDRNIFFGRQRVLDGWKEGNIASPGLTSVVNNNHVIAVTGRSGIGKSSLVMAGILSACNEDIVKKIKPGARPYTDHKLTLEETKNSAVPIYLFVDQYEELVTNCTDENERHQFEEALVMLSATHKIIVTLRSDFEIQFKQSPLIGQSATFCPFPIPPFTRDDFKEIVTGVAGQQALEFKSEAGTSESDDIFTNRIIDEAYAYPDSLPLLSLALSRMFDKRDSDANGNIEYLTEKEYNSFKGIKGIIEELADIEYRKYADTTSPAIASVKQKLLMQIIFRMISFEGAEITKRRLYKKYMLNNQEINELDFADNNTTATITDMCEGLINARLLKSDKDEQGNEYIEPAHEALLRSWPELTKALKKKEGQETITEEQRITNQDKVVLLRQVAELSRQYFFANPKDKKDLLWIKDYRLQQVLKLQGTDLRMNTIEEAFIHASDKAKKRNKVIRNTLITIAFAASLIISVVFFFQNKNIEAKNNDIQDKLAQTYWDQGINAAEQNDFLKSLLYTSEAMQTLNEDPNRKELLLSTANAIPLLALQNVFTTKNNIIEAHISGDGKWLLTISNDALLQVWDAMADSIPTTPLFTLANVSTASFSKDSKKILAIENNQINIITITGFKKTIISKNISVAGASFCADNNTIFGVTYYDSLFLWQQDKNNYTQKLVGIKKRGEIEDIGTKHLEISEDANSIIIAKTGYHPLLKNDESTSIAKIGTGGDFRFDFIKLSNGKYTENSKVRDFRSPSFFYTANYNQQKIIISYLGDPATLYDKKTANRKKFNSTTGYIQKGAFIGKSDSLLLTTENGIAIFDANTSQQLSSFFKTDKNAVAFLSPDNYHVLVLNDKGIISLFNTTGKYLGPGNNLNNPIRFSYNYGYGPLIFDGNEFEFSHNGKSIITTNGNTVLLFRLMPESIIAQPKEFSGSAKNNLSSKNSLIIPDSNTLRIWDYDRAEPIFKPIQINDKNNQLKGILKKGFLFPNTIEWPGTPYIFYIDEELKKYILDFERDTIIYLKDIPSNILGDFRAKGKQFTYTLENGSAYSRKAPDWKAIELFDSTKQIESINLINEGENILLFTKDSSVQLWETNNTTKGKALLNLPKAYIIKVADNSKWFIVQQEKFATIYKINENGDISHSIATPEKDFDFYATGEGNGWCISPDGEWIYYTANLTVENFNGHMYNTSTGKTWQIKPSADLNGSNDNTISIFSPDNKYFAVIPLNMVKVTIDNLSISLKAYSLQNLNNKDSILPQFGKTVKLNTSGINIDFCKYNTNIIYITSDSSISFVDMRKGKKIMEYNYGGGNSFLSDNGEAIYLTDTLGNLSVHGADLDMPAALYKKQAMVLSGSQLNLATGEIEDMAPLQWQQLKKEYMAEAADHYRHCTYRTFNIWANIYPALAARLKQ